MLPEVADARRHWGQIALAALVAIAVIVVPAGVWPWDHDEVATLVELGQVPPAAFPGPVGQLARMHRVTPVFHTLQNGVLTILPANEWGTRMMPALCGALTVVLAFVVGLRTRGVWFAWSLLILVGGSQTLVWLSQQNRFYSLALLLSALTFVAIWARRDQWLFDLAAACCGIVAILAHALTFVLFAAGFAAILAAWAIGHAPRQALRRAAVVLAATGAVYLLYLRPILAGWVSGNTGGTNPLVSFVAQVGIAPLALAVPGCLAAWRERDARLRSWWIALFAMGLVFVAATPWIFRNWNPRYGLFFMPAVWMLAAIGADAIGARLPSISLRLAWMAALFLFGAPKLASHFIDGSRHDFRAAAAIVAGQRAIAGDEVLSNWPAELQYYLEPATGRRARYWSPGEALPDRAAVIVVGSNAWEPVLRINGRSVVVVGEVGRRRFDEQSHLVRIYAVSELHH